ncbi:hypothetical protein NLJ89_g2166 [Agrocybe chaxingu]|uniref:BRCT domain-containing protein n=1 Tax=Agrocybe chaxingu TaxID=84603 RepID=A0A9W8K4X0_9AGAR|nr:hypothetical protein NLJ89_g2166 [Agrocybe chaxingu]
MKGSREQKERTEKEKETGMKAKKSVVASSSSKSVDIFASMPKGKEKAVDAEGPKIKMKDKMRKKEKTKESKPVKLVPTSDDEEQEQQERTEAIFMPSPVEHTVTEPESTPAKTLEPVEPSPLVIEDAVMEPPEPPSHEGPELPDSQDATMKDVEVEAQQEGEQSPDVPITATTVSPPLEPQGIEAVPTPEDGAIVQAEETSTVAEQKDEVVNAEQRGNVMEQVPTEPRPPSRSGPSKLPVGKKRQHISVAPANRVTRSVSSKKKDDSPLAPVAGPSRKKAPAPAPVPAKRTASGSIKKTEKKTVVEQPPAESSVEAPTEIETETPAEDDDLPPRSPMRMSSPAKMVSTPNKNTADTTPTKSRFDKMPTPSPSKIARATSLFSKPAHMSRTWSMDFGNPDKSTSSLSTLSNALEKLRMPPPARPSTSMGFNRDAPGGDEDPGRSQDDVTVGRKSLGIARSDSLKRHATVGAGAFKAIGTTGHGLASSSKAGGKGLTQKPLSMFMANKGKSSTRGGAIMRGTGRTSVLGGKPLFGVGGAARRTISKKTSLPMVVGSPVKGGGADTTMQEYEEDEEVGKTPTMAPSASGDDGDVFMAPANTSTGMFLLEDLEVEVTSAKGKEKETAFSRSNASRRVSMASHALSQSLSALPPPEPSKPRGMMGPPATPKNVRSTSSSYPSSNKGRGSSSSPPKAEGSGTRSSARLAKAVPKVVAQSKGSDGPSGKKAPEPAPNPAAEALRVLKDCVIFVDVKTDEGDEAGSLFVEMLEGVGAKVLTRVGQTCTHVVYKNGLMSTVTRYRLLRDPKPFVVGIGWVVECVEQRKHVDETNFLVDLEGVNVAGTHKRRRSMLPKLLSNDLHMPMNHDNTEDGDQSMDSQTSFTMDDGLAPLERARKRKNLLAAGGRL